jgi:membrane protein DedA with SNARE-associated domain
MCHRRVLKPQRLFPATQDLLRLEQVLQEGPAATMGRVAGSQVPEEVDYGRGDWCGNHCSKLCRVSAHEITQLIHDYGLIVVFLATFLQAMGFPVPGGTAVVIAAIDASTKRGLPLAGVITAGAAGALFGTTAGFAIGRWRGEALLLRLGRLLRQKPARVQQFRRQFQKHGLIPLFIARFVTAARNLAGVAAGASGMRFPAFCLVSACAAIAWSSITALEYYFAGHAILGAPTWLQIILIVLGIVATVISFRLFTPGMDRRRDRSARAAEAAD